MAIVYATPETDVQEMLLDGEVVVWAGSPRPGFVMTGADWGKTVFMLFWTGGAFFWTWTAVRGGHAICPGICGLPFLWVGVNQLVVRHFVEMRARRQTSYVATNRRAIIVVRGAPEQTRFAMWTAASGLSVSERADGSGEITFEGTAGDLGGGVGASRRRGNSAGVEEPMAFVRVDCVREAARVIGRALSEGGGRNGK